MEMPRKCGGKRIVDYGPVWKGRDRPDARIVCTKCGASWPMDSKGGGYVLEEKPKRVKKPKTRSSVP